MTLTPRSDGPDEPARLDSARGSPAEPGPRVTLTAELLTRRYLQQGVGAEQIAAETGWSGQYVRDRLRDHGIPLRRPGITKDPVDLATVSGWVDQGLSVPEMAARAGYRVADVLGGMAPAGQVQQDRESRDAFDQRAVASDRTRAGQTRNADALLLARATGVRIGELRDLELDCVHQIDGHGA